MKQLFVIIILLGCVSPLQSQSIDMDEWLVWILDRFGNELDEETLIERLENLESYLVTPVPISTLDSQLLHSIQLLTDSEVERVVKWVQTTDTELRTEAEFRRHVDVDPMVHELIAALVIFDSERSERVGRRWRGFGRGALHGLVDVKAGSVYPMQEGYRDGGQYLGAGFTLREQIVLQLDGISTRFSRYKMAGEPMEYPNKMGPWTGSIVYQNRNQSDQPQFRVRTFILGDHRFRSGHGLLAATGSMRVDGSQQRATSISAAPVTPNGASPSGKFHRGAALWASAGKTDLAVSYSSRRLSATITDTLLYTPGWSTHIRTTNDLNKHHNIRLSSVSVMARRRGQIGPINIHLGAAAVGFEWSDRISRRPGFSYEADYQGSRGIEWSMFTAVTYRDFAYTAELGQSNAKLGWIQSLRTQTQIVDLGIWARSYPYGFDSRFGNPASAYGGSNELGLGAWIRAKPVSDVTVMAWSDSYASMGPRFGTRLPVKGREWGVKADWKLGSGRRVEVSARTRSRLENEVLPDNFNRDYDFRVWNEGVSTKIAFYNPFSDHLRVKLQLSYSEVNKAGVRLIGWGSSALLILNFDRVRFYAQTSIFSSEDHESRSYFYEYDMLGSFRIPAFSGYGQRSYVMGHFEVWGGLVARIKVGVMEYVDRLVIGTGADASVGARRWSGDAQLRWSF
jgi:hypothetical protein